MPFLQGAVPLSMDRAVATPNVYRTTRGKEKSLVQTLTEEEAQETPETVRQPGAQEQVPRIHRGQRTV